MELPAAPPLAARALDPNLAPRVDDAWLRAQWEHPHARVLVFAAEQVAAGDAPARGLGWVPVAAVPAARQATWALLGADADGVPHFAADLGAAAVAPPGTGFTGMRELAGSLPDAELSAAMTALALLNWHRTHQHCSRCGTRTHAVHAGWQRRCPADDSRHFPRVDPAVIMLPVDADDRALLGRQSRWPQRWFSTFAGFVEPGESLEQAVRRELAEESGIDVGEVTYLASQPWPFPNSLMVGFHARARTTAARPDGTEIGEVRWFTRADLVAACDTGSVRLPPRLSISRWLIEQWFGAPLPGDWSR